MHTEGRTAVFDKLEDHEAFINTLSLSKDDERVVLLRGMRNKHDDAYVFQEAERGERMARWHESTHSDAPSLMTVTEYLDQTPYEISQIRLEQHSGSMIPGVASFTTSPKTALDWSGGKYLYAIHFKPSHVASELNEVGLVVREKDLLYRVEGDLLKRYMANPGLLLALLE